jgi:hypothetical protein
MADPSSAMGIFDLPAATDASIELSSFAGEEVRMPISS